MEAVRWCSVFLLLAATINAKISFYEDFGDLTNDEKEQVYDDMIHGNDKINNNDVPKIEIKMPNVHPVKHDSYFCTALPVESDETYIVGYDPHAEMHTAHHMLLFGCSTPASNEPHWNCGDMGVGVCGKGSGEKIMYAWGKNAPTLELPEGVAFKVGQASSVKYLVLQVHYGHVDKFVKNPDLKDSSGITIRTTHERPPHLAGILLVSVNDDNAAILPHKQVAHLDMACKYQNPAVMHPFAFRVHAHTLGTVITGYRVQNAENANDAKWDLIGKGDPQRPQAFYPVKDKHTEIKAGDVVAGRCTFNSMKKDKTTYIGATMKDEMCNFYMMFYYDPEEEGDSKYDPESSCRYLPDSYPLNYPKDSDKPLPGSGEKMEMKRAM